MFFRNHIFYQLLKLLGNDGRLLKSLVHLQVLIVSRYCSFARCIWTKFFYFVYFAPNYFAFKHVLFFMC